MGCWLWLCQVVFCQYFIFHFFSRPSLCCLPLDFNRKMKKGKKTKKRRDFGCWQRPVWATARHQMPRGREREASPVALAGHQGHLGHRVTLSNGHLFEGGHLLAVERAACQDTPLSDLSRVRGDIFTVVAVM